MTNTERIAKGLFLWSPCEAPNGFNVRYRWYVDVDGWYVGIDQCGMPQANHGKTWPDLTDWDWIRRMEDAIAEKGRLCDYIQQLNTQTDNDEWIDRVELERPHYLGKQIGVIVGYSIRALRATPAQRIAAGIAVLDQEGI